MDDEAVKWVVLGMAIASTPVREKLKGKSLSSMSASQSLIHGVMSGDQASVAAVLKDWKIHREKDESISDMFIRIFGKIETDHAMRQIGEMSKLMSTDDWLTVAKKRISEIEQWRKSQ
jgi:hypothetical protein